MIPMAIFKMLNAGKNTQVQLNTIHNTIMFDFHCSIYGKNFRFPSFKDPHRPLKFIVQAIGDVDAVFVSNSKSIGPLFLKNVKIYITRPVFEQILLRFDILKGLTLAYDDLRDEEIRSQFYKVDGTNKTGLPFSVSGTPMYNIRTDSEKYDVVDIDMVDVEKFKTAVIFIKYNQIVQINEYFISCVPSGTFVGWCNYLIVFPNTKSLLVLTSYSHKRRFSIEASAIKADYLIMCRVYSKASNDIEEFSSHVQKYATSNSSDIKPLLIPIDLPTLFIEVLFHVLSIVDMTGVAITVVSELFNRLDQLLNLHSEWLNGDFFSISEPFPMKKYENLKICESFRDIEMQKNIVFCSTEQYEMMKTRIEAEFELVLINDSKIDLQCAYSIIREVSGFKHSAECLPGIETYKYEQPKLKTEQRDLHIFNLKIESADEEILDKYEGLCVENRMTYVESESTAEFITVDSSLPIIGKTVVLNGDLKITDFDHPGKMSKDFVDSKIGIKALIAEDMPVLVDGWFICVSKRVKFRIISERQIEYTHF